MNQAPPGIPNREAPFPPPENQRPLPPLSSESTPEPDKDDFIPRMEALRQLNEKAKGG